MSGLCSADNVPSYRASGENLSPHSHQTVQQGSDRVHKLNFIQFVVPLRQCGCGCVGSVRNCRPRRYCGNSWGRISAESASQSLSCTFAFAFLVAGRRRITSAYDADLWSRRRLQSPYSIAPASQNPPELFENSSHQFNPTREESQNIRPKDDSLPACRHR